jgi:hypothetical protein
MRGLGQRHSLGQQGNSGRPIEQTHRQSQQSHSALQEFSLAPCEAAVTTRAQYVVQ